jgi:hypothetical protein
MATPDWAKKEVRANYAKASRAGRHAARTEPRAAAAAYLAGDEALRIVLTNGASLTVPIRLIPGLQQLIAMQSRGGPAAAAQSCAQSATVTIVPYARSATSFVSRIIGSTEAWATSIRSNGSL